MFGLFRRNRGQTTPSEATIATVPESATVATAVADAQPVGPPAKTQAEIEQERLAEERERVLSEFIPIKSVRETFVTKQQPRTLAEINADIERSKGIMETLKSRAEKAIGGLLPIEEDLKKKLSQERDRLLREQVQILNSLTQELSITELDGKYNRIDMGFLKRRKWCETHNLALPLFAVFNIDYPVCTFGWRWNYRREEQSNMTSVPYPLQTHFDLQCLQNLARKEYETGRHNYGVTAAINARFTAAIPQEVRDTIKKSRLDFDWMVLVTEAPQWELHVNASVPPQPVPQDPLVIGTKHGLYWLVTAFDTTSVEELVRREFTLGELEPNSL